METSVIIQVVCNGLCLFKLSSDFGFFQEKASILTELVKTSTAIPLLKSNILYKLKTQDEILAILMRKNCSAILFSVLM